MSKKSKMDARRKSLRRKEAKRIECHWRQTSVICNARGKSRAVLLDSFLIPLARKTLRVIGRFAQEGPATTLQIKPQVSRLVITAL
jgi:hypothetical protein